MTPPSSPTPREYPNAVRNEQKPATGSLVCREFPPGLGSASRVRRGEMMFQQAKAVNPHLLPISPKQHYKGPYTESALQPPSSDQTQAPALCFGPLPFHQCKIRYGSRKDASKMMHPSSFVHRILSVIDQLLLGAGKTNLKQNIKINRTSKIRYRFAELARGGNRAEAYKPGCL